MRSTNALFQNRFLTALPEDELRNFVPLLREAALPAEAIIETKGAPISEIYFLESGIAAVRVSKHQLMVAMVGNEGMSGLGFIFGSDLSAHEVAMVVSGTAMRISTEALREVFEKKPRIQNLFLRFAQVVVTQTTETALASVNASVVERLARWILMAQDRIGEDEITHITHHALASMLGTRRAGVTEGLHKLEGEGLIRSTRAHITILDRSGLKGRTGEFYGVPEAAYDRLITWAPPMAQKSAQSG